MTSNKLNQDGKILYATILPLAVILILILGAGYFLMQGEIKLPKLRKDVTELRRIEGFPTIVENPNQVEKQRLIIKTQEELSEFMNLVDPENRRTFNEQINFNKEFLIAVSTETEPTYGHEMRIKKLYLDNEESELIVQVQEEEPGSNCDEDKVPNVAFDIVAVSKNDLDITFERLKNVVDCEKQEDDLDS